MIQYTVLILKMVRQKNNMMLKDCYSLKFSYISSEVTKIPCWVTVNCVVLSCVTEVEFELISLITSGLIKDIRHHDGHHSSSSPLQCPCIISSDLGDFRWLL